jgi:3-hydroxyacyl-CoA dehydrogenase
MRFIHPPENKRLEIVRGLQTDESTAAAAVDMGRRMGIRTVVIKEEESAQESLGRA